MLLSSIKGPPHFHSLEGLKQETPHVVQVQNANKHQKCSVIARKVLQNLEDAETSLETCCAPPHVLHTGTESAGTRTLKAPKRVKCSLKFVQTSFISENPTTRQNPKGIP
eukprot:s898_g5.t1